MLTGCLIDDPPPYAQPKRTPPRLHGAVPAVDQILRASTSDVLRFSVSVASEDAGEGLTSLFFRDGELKNYKTLPPSTLEDTDREILFSYRVEDFVGYCHRFKIRVGHVSTLPVGDGPPLDESDVAEVYWLAYLNLPSDETVPVGDCFYLQEPAAP